MNVVGRKWDDLCGLLTHTHAGQVKQQRQQQQSKHISALSFYPFFLFWCFSPSHEAFLNASLKRPKYSSLSKPPLVSDVTASSCWTSIKVSKFPLQVCADSICQNILSYSFIHNGRLHHQKCFSCSSPQFYSRSWLLSDFIHSVIFISAVHRKLVWYLDMTSLSNDSSPQFFTFQ